MSSSIHIDTFKSYWLNLSDRDRFVLSVGSVIVFVYLFYLLIYAPLMNAVDSKSKEWVEKKETLIWMKSQEKIKIPILKHDSNLLSVFSNQLKHTTFSQFTYQLQQAGIDHIQLSFEAVPYVDFMTWLRQLSQHYTMTITELTAAHSKTPGVVKLKVLVENKGLS